MSAPAHSEPELDLLDSQEGPAPAGLEAGERPIVAARYRLLEHIASGGMGSVFRAEHLLSKKKMAVKVVHPYLCKGKEGVERFRREVSAAAEIDHPGIVQVYDAGVDDDGGFFMAMELLEGESLGDLLRRDWPGMKTAVSYIEGMLEPLAKAHEAGFVHRDLKPDNVFLAQDPHGGLRVKLLDFGLARGQEAAGATRTGITFGTPEYMSPEQSMSARKVKAPGDVWSVGIMLYELLSGGHPFEGETPNAVMANAMKDPLPPLRKVAPHVPQPLAIFIERCLEKRAEDRPQTAGQMLGELRAIVADLTLDETIPGGAVPPADQGTPVLSVKRPVSSLPASQPRRKRHPAVWVAAGFVVIASIYAGYALYTAFGTSADPTPGLASTATGPQPEESPTEPEEASPPEQAMEPLEPTGDPEAEAPRGELEAEAQETGLAELEAEARAAEPAGSEAAEATSSSRPRSPRAAPLAAADPRPSAWDEAQACLQQQDPGCARRVLEARARTPRERALLIDLDEDTVRKVERMRDFIRRHPQHREAARFRQYLDERNRSY